MYTEDLLQAQLEARQAGRDFAVATIAEALGSTPRTNGKMIVYADGTTLGTVGGGAAELQVTKDAVARSNAAAMCCIIIMSVRRRRTMGCSAAASCPS